MTNIYGIYSNNPSARAIINKAIAKANTMFNPSYNQYVEELTGIPSDRTAEDYAGCDRELKTNHK
jgi:hypothetical protein